MRRNELFPFRKFNEMESETDRFMDTFLNTPATQFVNGLLPTCEVSEKKGHYIVSFDLPGIPKEQVKIDLSEGKLHIHGERKEEAQSNSDYTERRYGKFERFVTIPESVSTEGVEAIMENGVLTVALKLTGVSKSKRIEIGDPKTSSIWSRIIGNEKHEEQAQEKPIKAA